MALVQVLYWQDIPAQVKAWDDFDEVKVELAPKFAARIDQVAQAKGLTQTDEYLAQWHWGEPQEHPGHPAEVAEIRRRQLEEEFGNL